jgi:hypothetical protein
LLRFSVVDDGLLGITPIVRYRAVGFNGRLPLFVRANLV